MHATGLPFPSVSSIWKIIRALKSGLTRADATTPAMPSRLSLRVLVTEIDAQSPLKKEQEDRQQLPLATKRKGFVQELA